MLICLSASHKNASFAILERLSGMEKTVGPRIRALPTVHGAVILTTCNRYEAYVDLHPAADGSPVAAVREAIRTIATAAGLSADELHATFDFRHGNEVARHLFAVTTGLESVVVGDAEIPGQVRRSFIRARESGDASPALERLFQRAAQVSRTARTNTGIGGAGRSLARLGLELAAAQLPNLADARVLLVGTGQFAGAVVAGLRDRGAHTVQVYSQAGRSSAFALSHGIAATEDLAGSLREADLVVTCTNAHAHVIGPALLVEARPADRPGPVFLDLGLPRNVDPEVARGTGVTILDLDVLRRHAPITDLTATEKAQVLVDRATRNFGADADVLDVTPAIVALRNHVDRAVAAEIARAASRGDSVEAALRHLGGVLLHTPMLRSRAYAQAGDPSTFIDAVEALFGIDVRATPDGSKTPDGTETPSGGGTPGDGE